MTGADPRSRSHDAPASDASSVLLTRQAEEGIEVLLLKRNAALTFAGGAYVFPGGRVEPQDCVLPLRLWDGIDLHKESRRMQVTPRSTLGLYVAAIRETFEESGILLASRDGELVGSKELSSHSFCEARRELSRRAHRWDWRSWLANERLVLQLNRLAWWSWWVTPPSMHKRFNTRFFLAIAPQDQEEGHDGVEMTASQWVSVEKALRRTGRRELPIILPTRKNIEALQSYATVEDAWRAAAGNRRPISRVQPLDIVDAHPDGTIDLGHTYVSPPHHDEEGW